MIPFVDSERAEELVERAEALMEEVVIPKGRSLAGGVSFLAGTVTDLRDAAWESSVHDARVEVSMAKVYVANVTQAAIDHALQFCDANGMTKVLPIADFYEPVRQFRIVEGADEAHRPTIA